MATLATLPAPPRRKTKSQPLYNFENLRQPSVATLQDRNCRVHWRPRCHPLASHLAMLIVAHTRLIPMHFRQKWLPWLPCQPPLGEKQNLSHYTTSKTSASLRWLPSRTAIAVYTGDP